MSEKLTDEQICDLVVDYMMKSRALDNSPLPSFHSMALRVAAFKHVRYEDSDDLALMATAARVSYEITSGLYGADSAEAVCLKEWCTEILSVIDDCAWMNAIQKEHA